MPYCPKCASRLYPGDDDSIKQRGVCSYCITYGGKMSDEKNYPYIRAWGKMLRSHANYIERQVGLASSVDAPKTSIFKKQDGTWATFDDIKADTTKLIIKDLVDDAK
jgi:hypothetical protein